MVARSGGSFGAITTSVVPVQRSRRSSGGLLDEHLAALELRGAIEDVGVDPEELLKDL